MKERTCFFIPHQQYISVESFFRHLLQNFFLFGLIVILAIIHLWPVVATSQIVIDRNYFNFLILLSHDSASHSFSSTIHDLGNRDLDSHSLTSWPPLFILYWNILTYRLNRYFRKSFFNDLIENANNSARRFLSSS